MKLWNLIDVSLNLLIAALWVNFIGHSDTFKVNLRITHSSDLPTSITTLFYTLFLCLMVVAIDSEFNADISY